MATYRDLLDAIAHVRACTGDVSAWMAGLSGDDLVVVTSPVTVSAPGAVDVVLAKIRAQHPELFNPPNGTPVPRPPELQEGSAAEAIRNAETSLAQQNSLTAQLDLQVIAAVLNAHSTHAEGRAALDGLQRDIEAAVATRTDLDTPAGARGFQRYLIGKLRDIRTVVETAGLDATSKASLAAALASLYTASASASLPATTDPERPPGASEPRHEGQPPAGPSESVAIADPAIPPDPGADPLLDRLLAGDLGGPPGDPPAQSGAAPAPMIPTIPAIPGMGGVGMPSLSTPLGGGLGAPLPTGAPPLTYPGGGEPAIAEYALAGEPGNAPADAAPIEPTTEDTAEDEPESDDTVPAGDDQTTVRLPNGETVTAASPQLARAITAAVAGTPIADAFRQQGITIPPPGSAVPNPINPARLIPGDIGIFTDRHALALGNGKAVLNNQMQPISSVTGPSFLGWEHPPDPGTTNLSSESDAPTPTRPAVTAGPSR